MAENDELKAQVVALTDKVLNLQAKVMDLTKNLFNEHDTEHAHMDMLISSLIPNLFYLN